MSNVHEEHFWQVEKDWANLSQRILEKNLKGNYSLLGLPSSFRDPESNEYFHVGGQSLAVSSFVLGLVKSLIRFIYIIFKKRLGRFTFIKRENSDVLVLSPVTVTRFESNKIKTTYLEVEDIDRSNWLLFEEGKGQEAKDNSYPSRLETLVSMLKLLRAVLFDSSPQGRHEIEAFRLNLIWILGGYWVHLLVLEKSLRKILKSSDFKLVHCVHEFHPHSRVLWKVAEELNIKSSSILHAPMEREKLWLFPSEQERKAGLKLPDNLALYNQQDEKLLSSTVALTESNIKFVCGPRFKDWKEKNALEANEMPTLLFVSSIAQWDNHTVLKALFQLADEGSNFDLLFRPHPNALLSPEDSLKLSQLIKDNKVSYSKGDLLESIRNSQIVLGMCTSVLDEALLLGRPAINLKSDEFTSLGSSIAYSLKSTELSTSEVQKSKTWYEENRETLISKAREKFGLIYNVSMINGGSHE